VNPTPYIVKVALAAFLFTISWFAIVWRNIGKPVYRHVAGMVYDCSILGFVMVELGRDFIGLYVVLPLISIGYGIRYRSKAYLWLGIILTVLTFCVAINIKPWGDAAVLYALILTLVLVPLKQIKPISEMIEAISALQLASKTKDRFISNVSHDLLTPINAIMGYCELERKSASIEGIRNSANHLSRQIRVLIDKTKNENLASVEHCETFSPSDLIKEMVQIVTPSAQRKGVKIEIREKIGTNQFFGPVDAIRTCLMNLLSNADKYTDTGYIHLTAHFSEEKLHFSISDTGIGIAPEEHVKIFDRFYRAKPADNVQGLGIGLAIVKETLNRVHGSISLASSATGTTFVFAVPVRRSEKTSYHSEQWPFHHTATGSLLLVDDDSVSRNVWAEVLRSTGCYVHVAVNGEMALAAISAGNTYDVYILDYRMPGMTGLDLSAAIRSNNEQAKIIMISADPQATFQDAITNGVVDAFLEKPFGADDLMSLVDSMRDCKSNAAEEKVSLTDDYQEERVSAAELLRDAILQQDMQAADFILHKLKSTAHLVNDHALIGAIAAAKDVRYLEGVIDALCLPANR
jgi:signal transduction histidine kinase/CheY-like chemotaxis protein